MFQRKYVIKPLHLISLIKRLDEILLSALPRHVDILYFPVIDHLEGVRPIGPDGHFNTDLSIKHIGD